MKTKQDLLSAVKTQLALEYNCAPEDFSSNENIVTTQRNSPKRRRYIDGAFFFQMVTFGTNAVITSNESMHDWLKDYVKGKSGHWLFEHNNLMDIEKKLNEYGKKLSQTHHMFLPYKEAASKETSSIENHFSIKWFEDKAIHQFYEGKMFPNALCREYNAKRPDVLAIAAYDGREIIAMAGCSADTPDLWQVGIDVNENYRGRGLGTYLVTLLKNEILNRGKIPFYGTSLSNLASWGIALNCGFYPVWIEISTIEK